MWWTRPPFTALNKLSTIYYYYDDDDDDDDDDDGDDDNDDDDLSGFRLSLATARDALCSSWVLNFHH